MCITTPGEETSLLQATAGARRRRAVDHFPQRLGDACGDPVAQGETGPDGFRLFELDAAVGRETVDDVGGLGALEVLAAYLVVVLVRDVQDAGDGVVNDEADLVPVEARGDERVLNGI